MAISEETIEKLLSLKIDSLLVTKLVTPEIMGKIKAAVDKKISSVGCTTLFCELGCTRDTTLQELFNDAIPKSILPNGILIQELINSQDPKVMMYVAVISSAYVFELGRLIFGKMKLMSIEDARLAQREYMKYLGFVAPESDGG